MVGKAAVVKEHGRGDGGWDFPLGAEKGSDPVMGDADVILFLADEGAYSGPAVSLQKVPVTDLAVDIEDQFPDVVQQAGGINLFRVGMAAIEGHGLAEPGHRQTVSPE